MTSNNKKEKFSLIYKEHAQSIVRLCYLYLKDESLAQDAAQDTFVKAYRKLGTFKENSNLTTWLTSIAINTCKSIMRNKSYKNTVSLNDAIMVPYETPDKETQLSVSEAVKNLPDNLRIVAILKYYRGHKTQEIAKILNIPVTTANYRLLKAKELLKEKLKEDFDYD